jgi:hypothetical protein
MPSLLLFAVRENYCASNFTISRFRFFRIVGYATTSDATSRALRRRYTFSIPSFGVHRTMGQ